MLKNQAAHMKDRSAPKGALYMAMELSLNKWKLAFSDGTRRPARLVTVQAGDFERMLQEQGKAKSRFGLHEKAAVELLRGRSRRLLDPPAPRGARGGQPGG